MCNLSKQLQIQVNNHTTEVITLFTGTRVQLLSPRQRDQSDKGFMNWKFMSVLSWGEQPRGTWVLDIIDEVSGVTTFPCVETYLKSCLISGFRHGVNQIFVLLGCYVEYIGVRGGVVVKALRYKPESCGFDSRWCHWDFSLT